jgi:hypothetical protein
MIGQLQQQPRETTTFVFMDLRGMMGRNGQLKQQPRETTTTTSHLRSLSTAYDFIF